MKEHENEDLEWTFQMTITKFNFCWLISICTNYTKLQRWKSGSGMDFLV